VVAAAAVEEQRARQNRELAAAAWARCPVFGLRKATLRRQETLRLQLGAVQAELQAEATLLTQAPGTPDSSSCRDPCRPEQTLAVAGPWC
jgi:hypothetical protein